PHAPSRDPLLIPGSGPRKPPKPEVRGGLHQTFRALRHRNFRLFVFGQIISLIGTWMPIVGSSWLVYRLSHSELLVGTAWFCSQIDRKSTRLNSSHEWKSYAVFCLKKK